MLGDEPVFECSCDNLVASRVHKDTVGGKDRVQGKIDKPGQVWRQNGATTEATGKI